LSARGSLCATNGASFTTYSLQPAQPSGASQAVKNFLAFSKAVMIPPYRVVLDTSTLITESSLKNASMRSISPEFDASLNACTTAIGSIASVAIAGSPLRLCVSHYTKTEQRHLRVRWSRRTDARGERRNFLLIVYIECQARAYPQHFLP